MTARGVWLSLAVTGVYLFLIVPIVIVILAALNAGNYLAFPPQGFSLRWFIRAAETEPFLRSFLFSLKLAGWVTVLSTVL
ncbi:MAG: ABC transporter permease, partial [Armatimonadota bacterium]|nr:ABC transporter permease [Armatimonadota bacterium]